MWEPGQSREFQFEWFTIQHCISLKRPDEIKMFNPNFIEEEKTYYMDFNLIIEVIKAFNSYFYV